ncbi:MAG: TonB-dependent receptor [Flavobacteriales bacterium]|nr:TonB-dependent receptor [Flavobacteriales bacterium]
MMNYRAKQLLLFVIIGYCPLVTEGAEVSKGMMVTSQTSVPLRGVVLDAESGQPVSFGILYDAADTARYAIVSVDGRFAFDDATGITALRLERQGYEMLVNLETNHSNELTLYAMPGLSQLNEVAVVAFMDNERQSKVPASIGYIDRRKLDATDQTSLQNALNTVPGVVMDSRGYGGSHRLSIRGSALRSPFAVRNVKMYLEGIPLTSPDGQTPLELIDAADISSIEIIKGPAGSVWGSGNGGVLLFKAKKPLRKTIQLGSGLQYGEFDLLRSNSFANIGFEKSGLRISHSWQENFGYREQEFNRKNQLSLMADHNINNKHSLFGYGTYFNGNWGLPGALTLEQVREDPRQAVQYSKDGNASVWRERLMAAVAHHWKMNDVHELKTSVYYLSTDKENPFGTSAFSNGFKDEGADGAGGRIDFSSHKKLSEKLHVALNLGGEYQFEHYTISEAANNMGQPGDFRYFFDVEYNTLMGFASANLDWDNLAFLNIGSSINTMSQQLGGYYLEALGSDSTAVMKSALLPRVALSFQVVKDIFLFTSASYGNSYPTIFELIDAQTYQYSSDLREEKGASHEAGIKGLEKHSGIQFELSAYEFELSDAIVQTVDTILFVPSIEIATVYENAGSTTQRGVELSLGKSFSFDDNGNGVRLWCAATVNDYIFSDYVNDGNDFSGKLLPGVAQSTLNAGLSCTVMKNFRADVMHFWMDKMPLDNNNTVWGNAYHLLNARINYSASLWKENLALTVFGGANNLLDTQYTSFYQLNGVGGKYYNPAPPLNLFGGLAIKVVVK